MKESGLFSSKKKFKFFGLVGIMVICALTMAACGDGQTAPAAAQTTSQSANVAAASNNNSTEFATLGYRSDRRPLPTRTVTPPTPIDSDVALKALQTWDSQTLGVTPTLIDAKGASRQVIAQYEIPTDQRGTIMADINATRTGYSARVQNGGFNVLLLGGGSDLSNKDITVQIQTASLGYLQLPAQTYPASSDEALTQLQNAFPALKNYELTPGKPRRDDRNAFTFVYHSKDNDKATVNGSVVRAGVVKAGNKIWVYAIVGTGEFGLNLSQQSV
ncbi:MAG TPA: hypothetical protein VH186_21465 [Chloroflexia bacterium]|nr:hypothetical protein [Chloroflexia bacterium]